jgi:hypothetical protein
MMSTMNTPQAARVVAIVTPVMKAAEIRTGFVLVTKMMADMICGPANMVMARGRIARFMFSTQYTGIRFTRLQGIRVVPTVGEICWICSRGV